MIMIDFGIICIGQEELSKPSDINGITVEGYQRTVDSGPFYIETYDFHTADKLLGYWYNIWLPESIIYKESFFDISYKDMPWIEVVPKWSKYVENILAFYINESPVNKIAVLLRIEDDSYDIVHPECSFVDFIQMLKEGRVRWNELYYVHL